jgi:hypothetical protein
LKLVAGGTDISTVTNKWPGRGFTTTLGTGKALRLSIWARDRHSTLASVGRPFPEMASPFGVGDTAQPRMAERIITQETNAGAFSALIAMFSRPILSLSAATDGRALIFGCFSANAFGLPNPKGWRTVCAPQQTV